MSNVLLIRHLPTSLSFQDKEKLLQHFGAESVWETKTKRNYIFASFASTEIAKASLHRLHQLELANRRLVVEYSFEKKPISSVKHDIQHNSITTKHVKEFLRLLNSWNPSVDFYQPPPVHLNYKYPDISPKTAINIMYCLFSHKAFYVQVLHLMNKMTLQVPFQENEKAIDFFKEIFRDIFGNQNIHWIPPPDSEPESELSSDENEKKQAVPKVVKRRHNLPVTRKRPVAMLSTATLPKTKKPNISQKEIFELAPIQEPKKISLVVHQDALNKQTEEVEVIGELGKFQKEEQPVEIIDKPGEPEQPILSKKELLKNRISYSDMKVLPVFKNYHPGQPSMRLYIKNLAKTVTEQDVKRIYRRYVEDLLNEEEQIGFDVRVMQEGRMKGQAFVTFPSLKLAETALNETNGYMLKERPMVVQFARAANKKTVD